MNMMTTSTYQTDAWCYLNLENPLCAWAAYRGVLVQAPSDPGFLSVWMASMLFHNNPERIAREFNLEIVRANRYPSRVSRLRGMYVFTDRCSADLASSWGHPFLPENLTEISLAEARLTGAKHDANWISYPDDRDWQDLYWSGQPHPHHEPIWETLAEGRLVLLGIELRNKAFDILQEQFPDTLVLLETARMAAWIGYDLGNVAAFLRLHDAEVSLEYYMNMREARDKTFLERIIELRDSGHPINLQAIGPLLSRGGFVLPDFRPYGFTRPLNELPYISGYASANN